MYSGVVTRIDAITPIEGADKIVLASVGPYKVIVGIDNKVGDIGLFFDADGQLDEEFCLVNDLIRRKDINGNPAGGMFDPNRRVRAIKMRGVISEGYWCPLEYLRYTWCLDGRHVGNLEDEECLKLGTCLNELNGMPICKKYETPSTKKSQGQNKQGVPKLASKLKIMFPEHIDTKQFLQCVNDISIGSRISLTEKLHGTSHRYAHVNGFEQSYVGKYFGWFYKLTRRPVPLNRKWMHVNGTRRVICRPEKTLGSYYGADDFRVKHTNNLTLHKNEVIYGEIVGSLPSGRSIMGSHSLKTLKSKQAIKQYGEEFKYNYGCDTTESKFLVYRIAMVNEDGVLVEYPWAKVKSRCEELGLQYVPELLPEFTYEDDHNLLEIIGAHVDGITGDSILPSTLDNHPREGVVVRVERPDGTTGWYKWKTKAFRIMEGLCKDDDTYVDMEEGN